MEWMFMPLRRYAEFSGRSRRLELWMYVLMLAIIGLIGLTAVIVMSVGAMSMASASADGTPRLGGMVGMFASMGIIAVIFGIIWLALLIPTIAVQVRRLHDSDRSGWWVFLYWGPYLLAFALSIAGLANNSQSLSAISIVFSLASWIGLIVLIVFYCLPGTNGPNRFGADPLGGVGDLSQTFQ
jgi:uncharacterized membrane protein YhaH (DUF805 family)